MEVCVVILFQSLLSLRCRQMVAHCICLLGVSVYRKRSSEGKGTYPFPLRA